MGLVEEVLAVRTRYYIVVSMLVLAGIVLSGCSGPPPFSEPIERTRITNALDAWVDGVERYDIDSMAGNSVLAPYFTLVMSEAGYTYTKDVQRLRAELEADRAWQEAFRKDQGYVMRLDIDGVLAIPGDLAYSRDPVNAWAVSFAGATKASATGFFEVFEKSTDVPVWWRSDSGSIGIEFTKTGAGWRMSEMHIRFGSSFYGLAPVGAGAVEDGHTGEAVGLRGAGFGMSKLSTTSI
jgi:hypothetical protein